MIPPESSLDQLQTRTPTMSQATVILITLVLYKIVLVGIGLWAQRRTDTNADFFLAGRQLGPVVAAISYAASSSSAWTLLGVSGAAFTLGISAAWLVPGILACHVACWFGLAPKLLHMSTSQNLITLTDVLVADAKDEQRRHLAFTAAIIVLVAFVFYVASQFQAAGNTFASNFDLSMLEAVTLGGVIVMIYTLLGGFWAVSVTDTLQGLLMAASAVVLPTAAFVAVGGLDGLVQGLADVSTPAQLSLTAGNAGLLGLGFIVGMCSVGLGTFGQPQLLTRFMALRDTRALKQARIIALSWFVVVFVGMLLLGWCGHVLMSEVTNGETVFFLLTNELFPPVVAGIILAAVLSAIMSTADSQLLVAASAVAHDMGLARHRPGSELWISRAVIALICLLAIVLAVAMPASIFSRVLFAWTGLGAAFGPIVIARVIGWDLKPGYVLSAMVIGFGLTAIIHALPPTPGAVAERVIPFFVASMIVLAGRVRQTGSQVSPETV